MLQAEVDKLKERFSTPWTSGPWGVWRDAEGKLTVHQAGNPSPDVASIRIPVSDDPDAYATSAANARLIAKAPEMAELLQILVDEAQYLLDSQPFPPADAYTAAEKLLA